MKTRQKVRKGIILISFFMFPAIFYYLSPVLIIQASYKGIINGSFIIFLFLFINSLFLGRVYCGWICPGAGCQESIFLARDKKITGGNYIKWLIWVPWICSIIILAVRAGGYREIDFFFETTNGLSIGNVFGLVNYLLVVFLLIALPAFIFGRRSFCHHICWMAPFMILGRKIRSRFQWPSLQLKSQPELCKNCHACTDHCPMSLPVEKMVSLNTMENTECILCGSCVDECKQNAIAYCWKQ